MTTNGHRLAPMTGMAGMVPVTADPEPAPAPDLERAERAAALFLDALRVPRDSAGLRDTPRRMARAYAEILSVQEFDATTFPNEMGYRHLIIERAIPFRSLCEHHFLPIVGRANVAYVPGERIVGLSKLSRLVEMFASRPQVQERLTAQIADWIQEHLLPAGVGVVLSAEHMCMTMRGACAPGASTVTVTLHGVVRSDPQLRGEFFALAGVSP